MMVKERIEDARLRLGNTFPGTPEERAARKELKELERSLRALRSEAREAAAPEREERPQPRNYLLRFFNPRKRKVEEEEWDSLESVAMRGRTLLKYFRADPLFWWQAFEMRELDERQVFPLR